MPMINGLKIPLGESQTIKDLIEKFFDRRCEILVSKNSKPIPPHKYAICKIKENDILQIVTYCKDCYRIRKRTILKPNDRE